MKFSYRKIDLADPFSSKQFVYRPIMKISLGYKELSLRFEALIDSGADFSIFPIEIAYRLNIPIKKAKKIYFSGVGGESFEGIVANIIIEVDTEIIKTKAVFTEAKENTGILGQRGFFDHFDVNFKYKSRVIEIQPLDS